MIAAANTLLDGQDDVDYWNEVVAIASIRIVELRESEEAFGEVLGASEGASLQALEAVEGTALTRTTEVDEFFRQQQLHQIIVQAVRLFQKWNGRSLGANDLQKLQEETNGFWETRLTRLDRLMQTLTSNRNFLEEQRGLVNRWTAELQSISEEGGWRQTFRDSMGDLPQQLGANLDEMQAILDEMTALQEKLQAAQAAPAPTNMEELRQQIANGLRLESDASNRLYERLVQVSSEAVELASFANRLEAQKARLESLQEIREIDIRNARRLDEARRWQSISTEDRDVHMQVIQGGRTRLGNLEREALAIFDNLWEVDEDALTDVTRPLDERMRELSDGVNALSGELDGRDSDELDEHLHSLPHLQREMTQGTKATVNQLGMKLRGVERRIDDAVVGRQELFSEVLALAKRVLEDLNEDIRQSVELKSTVRDWINKADSLIGRQPPRDVGGRRAFLREVRDLMTEHEQLIETVNRLAGKHSDFLGKTEWLEEQSNHLDDVASEEEKLTNILGAVNKDPEAKLSESLENQRKLLAKDLKARINKIGQLQERVMASCKRIFSEDGISTYNLPSIEEDESDSIFDAREELSDRWADLQDAIDAELVERSEVAGQIQDLLGNPRAGLETQEDANQAVSGLAETLQEVTQSANEQSKTAGSNVASASEYRQKKVASPSVISRDESQAQAEDVDVEAASASPQEQTPPEQRLELWKRFKECLRGACCCLGGREKSRKKDKAPDRTRRTYRRLSDQRSNDPEAGTSTFGSLTDADRLKLRERDIDPHSVHPVMVDQSVGRAVLQLENNDFVYPLSSNQPDPQHQKGKDVQRAVEHVIVPRHVVEHAGRLQEAKDQIEGRNTKPTSFKISAALMEDRPSSRRDSLSSEQGRGGRK